MRKNNYQRRSCGATYVWRVEWYNFNVKNGCTQYKAFRNKQDALIFMSKLRSNYNNGGIYLDKYTG